MMKVFHNIVCISAFGSLLASHLLAVTSGDKQAGRDIPELTRALGAFSFLDDPDLFDDFGDFHDSNITDAAPITAGTHRGHPWGDNQPEFMNFFAMQGELQQAGITDLRATGVNDLLARLERTAEIVNGDRYVHMRVVNAWVAEAPAWRGPLMCVLRHRWNVNASYPWEVLKLEWEPVRLGIEALVIQCARINM